MTGNMFSRRSFLQLAGSLAAARAARFHTPGQWKISNEQGGTGESRAARRAY